METVDVLLNESTGEEEKIITLVLSDTKNIEFESTFNDIPSSFEADFDTIQIIEQNDYLKLINKPKINGEVVGQIMYTFEWSDWRNGTFLWIQSAYVNKEFRGIGVFKALYKFIRDIADNDNNICGIRLYVEKENTIAKKTYKNIGMKECNYYIYEYDKE